MQRANNRMHDQVRNIRISYGKFGYAPGNVLFELGKTKVLCSVSLKRGVPLFLKGSKRGWLTAEYSMLPTAGTARVAREAVQLKRNYRSVEISRMIGRDLRSVIDFSVIGEQTIVVDCDVLQADGGTRTACLTAASLALVSAQKKWLKSGVLRGLIVKNPLYAISVGLVKGCALLDLDYREDSQADVDFNFVISSAGKVVEIQGTAESEPLSWDDFDRLKVLAICGVEQVKKICSEYVKVSTNTSMPAKSDGRVPLFSLKRREI